MPVPRSFRTVLASLLAALVLIVGLLLAAPADAGTGADEQRFVQLINQTRAGAGLPPLRVHPELTAQARSWASSMAGADRLAHASDISRGISAPWTVLGENVGVHGVRDVGQLHAAFVASPGHYANIVDARYGYVGVGVVVTEEGKLWTAHRFMATAEPPPTTAPPTTAPPQTAPPTTAPPTTAAPTPSTTRPATTRPSTAPPPSGAPAPAAVPTPEPATASPNPGRPTSPPTSPPTRPPTSAGRAPAPSSSDTFPADVEPAAAAPLEAADLPGTPTAGPTPEAPGGPGDVDELAPAATADGGAVEPVAAGPGRPDLATVEQVLIDLIEAGI